MSKRTTCWLGIAALAAACLLVAVPAHAGLAVASTDCGSRIQAPAKLVSVAIVDENGDAVEGALPEIQGFGLEVGGLGLLGDGAAVRVNDEIARGILQNSGDRPVLLTFADGETMLLAAGQQAAVAADAECKCKCKCVDGEASTWTTFPCDNNQDDCDYNGDACVFSSGGELHEGTFTECKKYWIIPPSGETPVEPVE